MPFLSNPLPKPKRGVCPRRKNCLPFRLIRRVHQHGPIFREKARRKHQVQIVFELCRRRVIELHVASIVLVGTRISTDREPSNVADSV